MKPVDNVERLVIELSVAATTALDERILNDSFTALEESLRIQQAVEPGGRRRILAVRIAKLAVAAVVIVAAAVAVEMFRSAREPSEERAAAPAARQEQVVAERQRIMDMFVGGDAAGLVAMLSEGQFESKVLAGLCLGEIGDERALAELQRLYLLAEANPPGGYVSNPFASPIAKILTRIEAERPRPKALLDVNEVNEIDANLAGPPDVNAAGRDKEARLSLGFVVVNKETGEPLEGVELEIEIQRDGPDERLSGLTDAEGLYTISTAVANMNHIRINVRREDFVPVQVLFQRKGGILEVPENYRLELEPATSIGGFVQNEQGQPIGGATVFLLVPQVDQGAIERIAIWDHEEKTDANGFWCCDHMPGELEEVWIRLAHPDYIDDEVYGTTAKFSVEQLRRMDGVAVMSKGITISGSVVDMAGRPIEGAAVSQGSDRWGTHYPSTKTDAQGRFEFSQARGGEMVLTVQADGFAPDLKEVTAYEGMEAVAFELEPGFTIRGCIVDSQHRPVAGAFVAADTWGGHRSISWRVNTDSQGRFEWNNAPGDEVLFDMGKEGFMSVRGYAMSASVDEYVIVMYRPLRVSGQVFDADSGAPIVEFTVLRGYLFEQGGQPSWDRRSAQRFTGDGYDVEFGEPRYGYMVRIEADGYLPAESAVFTDEQGEVVFDFALVRGEGPSGVVRLPDGTVVRGVEVALATPSRSVSIENGIIPRDRNMQVVQTDNNGRFSFPAQNDRYIVVAVDQAGYGEASDEELKADGDIILRAWGRVEGTLMVGDSPGANEDIVLYYDSPYERDAGRIYFQSKTVTDSAGCFVFEKARPGPVKVAREVKLTGRRTTYSHARAVDARAGETVYVTIGGGGRTLVGQLAVPPDYGEPADWTAADGEVRTSEPMPPYPDGYNLMSRKERWQWLLDWQKTERGIEFVEKHFVPLYPENVVDMNDQEIKAWMENWKQSDQGKAFAEARRERSANRRSYAVRIEADGTFRAEDVPGGKYVLQVSLMDRPEGRQTYYDQELIGSVNYEFEVPDTNEGVGDKDKALELGIIELKMRKRLNVGEGAPAFEAETFDGRMLRPAEVRGKAVLLIFWSSSGLYGNQLTGLKELFEVFREDEQFLMVGVSVDDNLNLAKEFVVKNEAPWVNCFFADEAMRAGVFENYGISRLPCIFLIGADGRILARNPASEQLEGLVLQALSIE